MMILDERVLPPLIKVLQTGVIPPHDYRDEVYNTILNFLLSFQIAGYDIETFQEDGIHLRIMDYGKVIIHDPSVEAVKEKLLWFANYHNRFKCTSADMRRDFGLEG